MEEFRVARPRRTFVYRERSERTGDLYKALAAATAKFLPVERDTQADWGWFASLKSMVKSTKPALSENDLAVTTEYAVIDGQVYSVMVLGHGPSDQWISSVLPVQQTGDIHEDAAYMTKVRRMTYAALLCLAPEDEKEVEKAVENADAKAAAQDWDEQFRLAKDAIAAAMNAERLASILAKAEQRANAKQMNPDHLPELLQLVGKREKELAAMVAKASAPRAPTKKPQEVLA